MRRLFCQVKGAQAAKVFQHSLLLQHQHRSSVEQSPPRIFRRQDVKAHTRFALLDSSHAFH